ncbi:unnamed protein product, partial [Nesidiocoris tenuis]
MSTPPFYRLSQAASQLRRRALSGEPSDCELIGNLILEQPRAVCSLDHGTKVLHYARMN